jgi:hypothetical protein
MRYGAVPNVDRTYIGSVSGIGGRTAWHGLRRGVWIATMEKRKTCWTLSIVCSAVRSGGGNGRTDLSGLCH